MIYKEEIDQLCEKLNLTYREVSLKCGLSDAYIHATIAGNTDPLSSKLSARIYHHFKRHLKDILPEQRIWVIREYIRRADPKPDLTEKSLRGKRISMAHKKRHKKKKATQKNKTTKKK